jgi:hypothetical protein
MDIHDISRSAMTYDVKKFYLIHPNDKQKEIFDKILGFWKSDIGAYYNQTRVDALSAISFTKTLEETIDLIKNQEKSDPIIITTTAKLRKDQVSFSKMKKLFRSAERPFLILFGTGNGLHESLHERADYVLKPIRAKSRYNYLSVRSAVAIVLDRLVSEE